MYLIYGNKGDTGMRAQTKIIYGIGIILLSFIIMGCDLTKEEYIWTFGNLSDYNITITCNDLTPSSFIVNSKTTKTATSTVNSISVTYNNASLVHATARDDFVFIFQNKE